MYKFLVFCLLVMLCFCSDRGVVGYVNLEVAGIKYVIPASFLIGDDIDGGIQDEVTLYFAFPSMQPTVREPKYEFIRNGEVMWAMLSTRGRDAEEWRAIALENWADEIIEQVQQGNLTIYRTNARHFLNYYFLNSGDNKLFFSCTKEDQTYHAMCNSSKTEISPGVFLSYYFSIKLLHEVANFSPKVLQLLDHFNMEVKQ